MRKTLCGYEGAAGWACSKPATVRVGSRALPFYFCAACETRFRDDYVHERNLIGILRHGKDYPTPVRLDEEPTE